MNAVDTLTAVEQRRSFRNREPAPRMTDEAVGRPLNLLPRHLTVSDRV